MAGGDVRVVGRSYSGRVTTRGRPAFREVEAHRPTAPSELTPRARRRRGKVARRSIGYRQKCVHRHALTYANGGLAVGSLEQVVRRPSADRS